MKTPRGDSPSHRTWKKRSANALCGVSLQRPRRSHAAEHPFRRRSAGTFLRRNSRGSYESGSFEPHASSKSDRRERVYSPKRECVHEVLPPWMYDRPPRVVESGQGETQLDHAQPVLDWERWSQSLGGSTSVITPSGVNTTREIAGVIGGTLRPRHHYDRWRDIDGSTPFEQRSDGRTTGGSTATEASDGGAAACQRGNASGGTKRPLRRYRRVIHGRLDDRRLR